MKVVRANISGNDFLIETMVEDFELVGEEQSGRMTEITSISDDLKEAYARAKETILSLADDLGSALRGIDISNRPRQMEMEFNMGFSAQAGIWILTGKGDCALKVRMSWESNNEQ